MFVKNCYYCKTPLKNFSLACKDCLKKLSSKIPRNAYPNFFYDHNNGINIDTKTTREWLNEIKDILLRDIEHSMTIVSGDTRVMGRKFTMYNEILYEFIVVNKNEHKSFTATKKELENTIF